MRILNDVRKWRNVIKDKSIKHNFQPNVSTIDVCVCIIYLVTLHFVFFFNFLKCCMKFEASKPDDRPSNLPAKYNWNVNHKAGTIFRQIIIFYLQSNGVWSRLFWCQFLLLVRLLLLLLSLLVLPVLLFFRFTFFICGFSICIYKMCSSLRRRKKTKKGIQTL